MDKIKKVLIVVSLIITVVIGIGAIGVYPYRLGQAEEQIEENSENIAKLQQYLYDNNLILSRMDERLKRIEETIRNR